MHQNSPQSFFPILQQCLEYLGFIQNWLLYKYQCLLQSLAQVYLHYLSVFQPVIFVLVFLNNLIERIGVALFYIRTITEVPDEIFSSCSFIIHVYTISVVSFNSNLTEVYFF